MLRKPAVAGYFYEGSPEKLRKQVNKYVDDSIEKTKAIGILSPHAGFLYSGAAAGAVYSSLKLPETFILIGPNHTGVGKAVSVFAKGSWDMPDEPNGIISIDEEIAGTIISKSKYASEDYSAHIGEHSLEVQIPFIQHFIHKFKIVPIIMMSTTLEVCKDLGHAISEAIKEAGKDVLIIASSDMTHYESAASAKEKDNMAIDKILSLDPPGLHAVITEHYITMCGFAPAVSMLYASLNLGAARANLVKYMNSGDVNGDYDSVVGYAGIIIS